ncbi:hypothetical protein [Phaeobacter gallaeciensis]|uniref:hypothetical protein n=1 Tax=Phaeobacter gallaeciensis TaxID=60890 RepID=UPI00237FAD8C|nr:hypothetical protein [Phaeobacter gallaeciensis]MDE4096663.1 hypothetical protein [Phaeobacter gallaeciensis]MDE4105474.1 hypothetical protein [Phaeobacter gallaeciensis]MDE4109930.1 hypothetical protein [Phaeobacter gallaeciensis]MDE4114398.1 hypothetical protein [Phaeobacter gallaeciensis]MDE4118865.1 hypothetical protein [Phaeobacter gallaeciensis]
MAMTEAEKKRVQRQRADVARRAEVDSTYPYLKETFSEFLDHEGNYSNVEIALGLAGIEAPLIDDERDPEAFALEDVIAGVENPFPGAKGAIGRAEVMVDCFIDAAIELAAIVNNYKRAEITARFAELEHSSETDRAEAMKEAVRLNKMLDQLNKQVRRSFPQWKVTGV